MGRRTGVVLAVGLLFLVADCRRQTIGTDVVATIGGDKVPYSAFESYVRDNVDSSDLPLDPSVLEQLFDQFLDEQLLVRLALDRGFPNESGEGPADQRSAVAHLLREIGSRPQSPAEVSAYYEAHRDEYRRPASVRLNQILARERADAEAALAALAEGEEFAQVAARFSQVPMAPLGDGGGRLTRDDLPPAFADSIFELGPGEVSEIVAADYGFHIFQVVERFPSEAAPLDEVDAEIRRILESRRLDELVASFVEEARGRYNVRIHRSNFPFDYRGSYAERNNM